MGLPFAFRKTQTETLTKVDDIFLFNRYEYPLEKDLEEYKRVIKNRLLFLNGEEWSLINKEIDTILKVYKSDSMINDDGFIRAYEWLAIVKDISNQLSNHKIDTKTVIENFRKGMLEEPERKNVLWLLLISVYKGIFLPKWASINP